MDYKRIALLLEDQLKLAAQREHELLKVIGDQNEQLSILTAEVESLNSSVLSLEKALLEKNASLEGQQGKVRILGKMVSGKKSEQVPVPDKETAIIAKVKPGLKERGNNGARRKEYFNLETCHHDIYPDAAEFKVEEGKKIRTTDCIRYEFIPPRFIKHIYHQHYYACKDTVYAGSLPAAPLLNSNYDASFIANLLAELGFELNMATAHGMIKKAAGLFDLVEEVLKEAVLSDNYLSMDESYYTVLTSDTNNRSGKSTAKGYIWAALANHLKLVHFFYENGSRSRKVLTGYLREDYRGAIQSDGLGIYKIIEKEAYPDAIRLSCFQHCKRKFLNITGNKDAEKIVRIINRLYQNEHRIPPDWTARQILEHRNKYAPPILKELKEELINIKDKKSTLPKSELSKAINYTLNEYDALCNYIRSADYAPDNNAIERLMRYISLSRRNSLFCGSHQGAKRAALIYSLACSCRLNNINSFEYFKDLLTKLIDINPNTDHEIIRNLLPDKWQR